MRAEQVPGDSGDSTWRITKVRTDSSEGCQVSLQVIAEAVMIFQSVAGLVKASQGMVASGFSVYVRVCVCVCVCVCAIVCGTCFYCLRVGAHDT